MNTMKGIILTGGTGSRLYPLTKTTNKCLLPVGDEPMVYRMIDLLKKSGITEIMLVTGVEHMGQVITTLGSGSEFGCDITYKVQDRADGIAAALKLCRDFVKNSKFAVILGDNIFSDHDIISAHVHKFSQSAEDWMLFCKKMSDPNRFGVLKFENDVVVDVIEKPKTPVSDYAVVGLYCYTPDVFEIIDGLQPSARGEYEISDVNSTLVRSKWLTGSVCDVTCDWVDAGTHESYRRANQIVWKTKLRS